MITQSIPSHINVSSSDDSLGPSDMNSDSLPTASSPCPTDNAGVLSQRELNQGETVPEAPQGNIPGAGRTRGKTPLGLNAGGSKSSPKPNTAPEPPVVPDSVRQPLAKGGKPSVLMASVHLEASDNLLEVLRGASIDEEHRTIMSAVVEKVQSAKSGLTEACTSLLTGFEISKECVNNITA